MQGKIQYAKCVGLYKINGPLKEITIIDVWLAPALVNMPLDEASLSCHHHILASVLPFARNSCNTIHHENAR